MDSNHFTSLLTFFSQFWIILALTQNSLTEDLHRPPSNEYSELIAVVGGGISGAIFAFELKAQSQPLATRDVTIFEREGGVGGRTQSVLLPHRVRATVEAGAPCSHAQDWCTNQAIKDIELEIVQPTPLVLPRTTGIWNGSHFRHTSTCAATSPSWTEALKYGLSSWRWRRAVRQVSDNWDLFTSSTRVTNVTQELERCALNRLVTQSADEYLTQAGISQRYSSDVVDSCTRQRLLQASPDVHSLAALMATRDNSVGPVGGGNQRLVERLLQSSKSQLRLDAAVLSIGPGKSRRYNVTYSTRPVPESGPPRPELATSQEEFDEVVIATPLHTANIDLGQLGNFDAANTTRHFNVHVTHFMTPAELCPSFFNLPNSTIMTDDIMVTAHASQTNDLYSISRSYESWIDNRFCYFPAVCDQMVYENLYRIVSRGRIEDNKIIGMIGGLFKNNTPLAEQRITWVHRQRWPSAIPAHQPKVPAIPQLELAPGLFYLGVAEEVISSMEETGNKISRRASFLSPKHIIPAGKCVIQPDCVLHSDLVRLPSQKPSSSTTSTDPKPDSKSADAANADATSVHLGPYYPLRISDSVYIGPFTTVRAAEIKSNVHIGAHCSIGNMVIIKDNVRVLDGTVLPANSVWSSGCAVGGRPGKVVGEVGEAWGRGRAVAAGPKVGRKGWG